MLTILGTIAVVIASVIAGLLVDRRWPLLPRPDRLLAAGAPRLLAAPTAPGGAPATALDLSPGEIERLRHTTRHCRRTMDSLADDAVDFEGTAVRVLRFRCDRCGALAQVHVRAVS